MKKTAFVAWVVLRATRWLCYIGILAYAYLELMMREKGGIARPDFFRLMPPAIPPQSK
jgi:hypothetical protein